LPDPHGPLSARVSSDCIRDANKEVSTALKEKCTPYIKAIQDQKAVVGKYAVDHGMVNAIRRFQDDFLNEILKKVQLEVGEISIVEKKMHELKKLRNKPTLDFTNEKKGRPLTLPEEIDIEAQQHILHLQLMVLQLELVLREY